MNKTGHPLPADTACRELSALYVSVRICRPRALTPEFLAAPFRDRPAVVIAGAEYTELIQPPVPGIQRGYWHFYTLSNSSVFMAPGSLETYGLYCK